MLTKVLRSAVIPVALTVFAATGWSQTGPRFATQLTVEVKPGGNLQFEEFSRAFRDAAEETGSSLYWLVSQNEAGDRNTYTFTRQFGDWSAFENPANAFMAEAYDEDELARLLTLYANSVETQSWAGYVVRRDLSREGGPTVTEPAAVIYIDITARPGMAPEFEALARDVVAATATSAPNLYWTTMATTFGPGGTYRLVVIIEDWEDLNIPPKPIPDRLIEHFGAAEGLRLAGAGASAIESISQNLRRVLLDLARPQPD